MKNVSEVIYTEKEQYISYEEKREDHYGDCYEKRHGGVFSQYYRVVFDGGDDGYRVVIRYDECRRDQGWIGKKRAAKVHGEKREERARAAATGAV